MPHFAKSLCFDLADALASDLELPPDLFQGAAVSVHQPKPLLEDLAFTIGESFQHILDFFLQQNNRSHVAGVLGASILNEIAEVGFLALAHGRLKRDRL